MKPEAGLTIHGRANAAMLEKKEEVI